MHAQIELIFFLFSLQIQVDDLMRRIGQMDRLLASERRETNANEGKRNEESNNNDNQRIKKLENDLKISEEENNRRVADTSQYKQMKNLMQTQSGKIRDLKRRLDRYEPDSVKEDDDDF